jgi:hypothetical protein
MNKLVCNAKSQTFYYIPKGQNDASLVYMNNKYVKFGGAPNRATVESERRGSESVYKYLKFPTTADGKIEITVGFNKMADVYILNVNDDKKYCLNILNRLYPGYGKGARLKK